LAIAAGEAHMKILVAVDENVYSRYAVGEAARLAANTWPDVTLLAVDGDNGAGEGIGPDHPKAVALRKYRDDFLARMDRDLAIYGDPPSPGGWSAGAPGVLEETSPGGRKTFKLRLRKERPYKAILAESKEERSDLLVMGSGQGDAAWEQDAEAPGKVAENADCSVLVIKEARQPAKVSCCLDHDNVSQQSLETINQLVTLYKVDLEIVGVMNHGELKENVERKMREVLDYYVERGVRTLVKVVEARSLNAFISASARTDLVALWMGAKSMLRRFFPSNKVAPLVNNALSSVLILR
jgi:nucleotide-binding universal stress UspA family protein